MTRSAENFEPPSALRPQRKTFRNFAKTFALFAVFAVSLFGWITVLRATRAASYNQNMSVAAGITPQTFATFGELLRYLRERVELSQKELALQVGYHYSYMCRIEKNQRTPDTSALMTRFVPALALDDEPQWTARLLELAGRTSAAKTPPVDLNPSPTTALPIFDLSASNLPIFLNSLLGRDKEVNALTDLLNRADVRLVTLMGPPGVGKTRLAAHVASQTAGAFAHGSLFVDMTPITDADEFLPILAQSLGVQETSDGALVKNIIASLRPRNLLLVIDNMEHIINAASHLPNLLMSAPNVKALVTSRESLHVSGEHEFPLPPLPFPRLAQASKDEEPFEVLSHFAAVQLFTHRAQAVQPDFKLDDVNVRAVAEICQQLDGLPLAIELAAVRVKTLSPQAMLTQLNRRLEWLTRGARVGARGDAKQTLRGALEWSYNLLSESERVALRRLSVFVDGCTLRAVEAICADPIQESDQPVVRREDVLNLLGNLIDKSLVAVETNPQQVRYHALETMRELCREKLEQAGELDEVLTRHLMHFTEYAEESESHLDGTEQGKWIRITEKEHGNFRAALDYALSREQVLSYGLRVGAGISLFWLAHNHFHEGIERLNKLIEKAEAPEHRRVRARMLYRCGAIQARLSSYNAAYKLCEQSIALGRELNDSRILASALYYLGDICTAVKDYDKARTLLDESVSVCWGNHYPTQLSIALTNLGTVLYEQGESERAFATAKEALAIAAGVDDTWGMSHALQLLGGLHRLIGERDAAIRYFERSLPHIRELGDRLAEGVTLVNLSMLHNLKKDYPASGHAAEASLVAFQAIGDELQQPFPLRLMGYSAIHAGNIVRARKLILESLKGNRALDHLTGQLACLVAIGACELAEGNAEKAVTYAALVESRLNAESISLMEPDSIALNELLANGKTKVGVKSFNQIIEKSKSLRVEDVIASELPI